MKENAFATRLRKLVIKIGRKAPPTKKPEWAFFFGGLMLIFVLNVPVVISAMELQPFVGDILKNIPYWPIWRVVAMVFFIGYVGLWSLRYFCRGVQLCYPEELEAWETESDLAIE